jgi:hypothetical protein
MVWKHKNYVFRLFQVIEPDKRISSAIWLRCVIAAKYEDAVIPGNTLPCLAEDILPPKLMGGFLA